MLRIGIVCYPTYGGSGVVATELGKALAHVGHEVHFISSTQPFRLDIWNEKVFYHEVNVASYPLFEYPPYILALAGELVDVVKYHKLDLLHVHYAIPHATAAQLAQQVLEDEGIHIPVITTLHGTDITLVGKDKNYEPLVRLAINRSQGVTAVSHSLAQDTRDNFRITRPIEVIHNFVDTERFKPRKTGHFRKAIAPNDERILVHISNFRKLKRADLVIDIFSRVNKEIPSKLLLVGDGPERQKVEQLARDLQVDAHVRFLGKQEAVEEILSVCDLFLMPSESESFGLAALEAMACGVPVVSSDIGGLPEVNIPGVTGYLSPMDDADDMTEKALSILREDAVLEDFRQRCREQALKFRMENILPHYIRYYEQILGRPGACSGKQG